jgi:hypothetical protein
VVEARLAPLRRGRRDVDEAMSTKGALRPEAAQSATTLVAAPSGPRFRGAALAAGHSSNERSMSH